MAEARDKLKASYENAKKTGRDPKLTDPNFPASFVFKRDESYLLQESIKVGILPRKRKVGNDDLFGLIELSTYGLKGLCAYFYHAEKLRGSN